MATGGVTAETLYYDAHLNAHILTKSIADSSKRARAEESPWLGLNPFSRNHFRNDYLKDVVLPMRVYPSLPGREILEMYYNSIIHENKGEPERAAALLEDMRGTYPDVDPQNKLEFGRRIIKSLIKVGQSDRASQAAVALKESLAEGDTHEQAFIVPDTLRRIGSPESICSAISLYNKAGFGGKLREAKLAKARQELKKAVGRSRLSE